MLGSFHSAWTGELARLRRVGGSFAQNQILGFLAASALHAAAFYVRRSGGPIPVPARLHPHLHPPPQQAWLGVGGLLFFLGQAWVGFSLLELVNYIEHYGLRRRRLDDGRYEPVNPTHSWNAPQMVTNFFLFKVRLL